MFKVYYVSAYFYFFPFIVLVLKLFEFGLITRIANYLYNKGTVPVATD